MTERDAFLRAIVENPEDRTPQLVFADWLEEHGLLDESAAMRAGSIVVDNDTYIAIRDLGLTTMTPGSWDKRFARDIRGRVTFGLSPKETTITVKQWACVWRMAWRYRRQVSRGIVARAKVLILSTSASSAGTS